MDAASSRERTYRKAARGMMAAALLAMAAAPVLAVAGDAERGTACTWPSGTAYPAVVHATLAGVPAIVRIPAHVSLPPVILWHGFGAPGSEAAMMDALPLDDVDAVKAYLGLPLFGARAPAGGMKELARRQAEDVGTEVFKPVVVGAGDELPAVVAALRDNGCMRRNDAIDLVGFSAGGAAVLYALAQDKVRVNAAVLINPSTGLSASVRAYEHATKQNYAWSPASRDLAHATDATARAAAIGHAHAALLFVTGRADDVIDADAIAAAYKALNPYYAKDASRLEWKTLPDVTHQWADDARSQASVRAAVSDWLRRAQ